MAFNSLSGCDKPFTREYKLPINFKHYYFPLLLWLSASTDPMSQHSAAFIICNIIFHRKYIIYPESQDNFLLYSALSKYGTPSPWSAT